MYTRTWCRSRQTSQAKKPLITWEHFDHCMSSKPAPMLALRRVQPSKFGLARLYARILEVRKVLLTATLLRPTQRSVRRLHAEACRATCCDLRRQQQGD